MNKERLASHIQLSIDTALAEISNLPKDALAVRGFSTPVMRHLFSNIVRLPKAEPSYLEVGLYGGASFCAAVANNENLKAFGVENFSQDFGDPGIADHLRENLDRYRETSNFTIIDDDFFTMDLGLIDVPIDVFFYDGHHDEEWQRKAWSRAEPLLSPLSIVLVDDFQWDSVRDGTERGIEDVQDRLKVTRHSFLTDHMPDGPVWHNGVSIFICEK